MVVSFASLEIFGKTTFEMMIKQMGIKSKIKTSRIGTGGSLGFFLHEMPFLLTIYFEQNLSFTLILKLFIPKVLNVKLIVFFTASKTCKIAIFSSFGASKILCSL